MLENCKNAKERWGGVNELIDKWLQGRQELIVRFCDLAGADAGTDLQRLRRSLLRFCEVLVDYVSAGHFEIYEQLTREASEFNDGGLDLIQRLYPKIEVSTEAALAFNDSFDAAEQDKDLLALLAEVSGLGEMLEERFELEDTLIEALHTAHADQVA